MPRFVWFVFSGQWLPVATKSGSHQLHAEICALVEETVKNLLLYLMPQQEKSKQERILSEIQHAYESLHFLARMKETTEVPENHDMTFDVSRGFHMAWLFHVVVLI